MSMLEEVKKFFSHQKKVIQMVSKPVIELETGPKKCICGFTSFNIYNNGALYKCPSCQQRYVATLTEKVNKTGACPDCGSKLFEGPTGGCSMNVQCEKGHRFNISFMMGIGNLVERN